MFTCYAEIIDSNNLNNCYYCSFKIFCCFLLAPIHRLILHNQPALTNFGRWEQYTIDAMIYVFRNEVDRWYIWLETRLHGKKTIDQPRFQAGPASCLFTSELGMFGMGAIYYSVTICDWFCHISNKVGSITGIWKRSNSPNIKIDLSIWMLHVFVHNVNLANKNGVAICILCYIDSTMFFIWQFILAQSNE